MYVDCVLRVDFVFDYGWWVAYLCCLCDFVFLLFCGLVGFVLVGGWFSVWLLCCCVCDELVWLFVCCLFLVFGC